MSLEKWVEEFLDSGGQITVCKTQERRQTRFKSKHKGKLFPKAKKEPKRKLVVRKRQNGLTCEVTVKKVNPKKKGDLEW